MQRPAQTVLSEAGAAFQRLYQAERNAVLSTGQSSDPGALTALGADLDATLARDVNVPALQRARQRQARIWKTPPRR